MESNDQPAKVALSKPSLSQRGMTIRFEKLNYVVLSNVEKGAKVRLLKDVHGFFLPGQMAALMGPSGSGKTTLLDVLAGRKTVGEIKGSIQFGGETPSQRFLRRYTGYVEQFDTLLDMLTVEEMLMYTAELKRPVEESLNKKKGEVDTLLDKLALTPARNTRIGNSMHRGISGGQAKRVNVAIALITDPRVLFLDEPTSGLDSYTANEVMTYVKKFASDGVTICATIHSPSPYAFSLFDRVMMLVRGEIVYFGGRGQAQPYFTALAPHSAMTMDNEAEWLTDVIVQADREKRGSELAAAYKNSELKKKNEVTMAQHTENSVIDPETLKELSVKRATVTPFWFALKILLKYRTARNFKNPEFLGPRLGDKLIFSLLIGTLYWGVGSDFSTSNLVNVSAVLFMWSTLPAFGAASYVPSIVLERALFTRERNDGLYRVITYLCAKAVEELSLAAIAGAVFGIVVFLMLDLQGSFLIFFLGYFISLSIGIVLAYFVATASPNMDVANAALPAFVVTLLFFAGFLLRQPDIPDYWAWYSKLDFIGYAWSALMLNQFEGENAYLFSEGGDQVHILDFYHLRERCIGANLGILCAFFVCFFGLAYVVMTKVKHSSR